MADEEKPKKDAILIEEVCALLGPPRRVIYALASSDPDFPKPAKIGKRLYFVRAEILAYREKKQNDYAKRHLPSSSEAEERRLNAARAYARMLRYMPKSSPPKK